MNYVYGVPKGFRRVWTSEPPTATAAMTLSEQTKGDAPVGQQQRYSDAKAKEMADNIVWFASVMDNVQWLRDETKKRNALPPSAAEFPSLPVVLDTE